MGKKLSIAIDGPASAGKSTVAKIVASELAYIYVDTGAMYRAITYAAIQNKVPADDEQKLMALLATQVISFEQTADGQLVYLNDKDVTASIRLPDVTNMVSEVSAHAMIRKELVKRQQAFAINGGIVMDGRDIGTAVLPNADVKIFLIASVEERAERRYKENLLKGIATDFSVLKQEIEERDYKDTHRAASPLVQAPDAILLDTTGLSIQEVVTKIQKIVRNSSFDEKKEGYC